MKARTWLMPLVSAGLVVYPALVYFGLTYGYMHWLMPLIVGVFVARSLLCWRQQQKEMLVVAVIGLLLALSYALLKQQQLLLWYPVVMSSCMLLVFGLSVLRPPTVIERVARWRHPDLPAQATKYLTRVTLVWCLFFIVNGMVATYTIVAGPMKWWALYNGLLSYCLMALLLAGEWVFRYFFVSDKLVNDE